MKNKSAWAEFVEKYYGLTKKTKFNEEKKTIRTYSDYEKEYYGKKEVVDAEPPVIPDDRYQKTNDAEKSIYPNVDIVCSEEEHNKILFEEPVPANNIDNDNYEITEREIEQFKQLNGIVDTTEQKDEQPIDFVVEEKPTETKVKSVKVSKTKTEKTTNETKKKETKKKSTKKTKNKENQK